MFSIKKINLFTVVIIPLIALSVQASEINFNSIKALDEFPKHTVWSIKEDQTGFIWLGGDFGLLRYDGFNIKPINDIIPNVEIKKVRVILSDSLGTLWVGTKNNGIYKFFNNTSNFTSVTIDNGLNSNSITAVSEGTHKIWVGTSNGLNTIDKKSGIITKISLSTDLNLKPDTLITSINTISEHEIIFSTRYRVFLYNNIAKTFREVLINEFSDTYINSIYQDFENNLWMGTDKGIFFSSNNIDFQQYKHNKISQRVNAIEVDENYIWLGSVLNGLIKISKKNSSIETYSSKNSSLLGNSIVALLLDSRGVMFMSSFHNGLSYFNSNNLFFGYENNSISGFNCIDSSVVNGINYDETGSIWLVTEYGLVKYNSNQQNCTKYSLTKDGNNAFFQNIPYALKKISDYDYYLGTDRGVYLFNHETKIIEKNLSIKIDVPVHQMIAWKNTGLLIGTYQGLYKFIKDSTIKVDSLNKNLSEATVYNIIEFAQDSYYLATSAGVARFDGENYEIYSKVKSQMPKISVYSLFIDDTSNLWVGTSEHGLYKFNSKGELLIHFNQQNGLPKNASIFSILTGSKHDLWVSTNQGLIELNTKNNEIKIFHKKDGIQGEHFSLNAAYKAPDGKLYFGGRNGFNAFYPEDIKLNTTSPNIVLTDFSRFGKSVEVGVEQDGFLLEADIDQLDELVLSHKDYVVGFEFAALDYADPARNKYAYMLEGQDPQWIYTNADNRRISYSNLSAGTYTFRVKGANKDGIWNEQGKSLKVIVKPAPWFSWWAYVIYLLTFLSLLHWTINRKNKANQRITQMLRIEVAKQTKELQAQKQTVEELLARKNELFANVSHEFRTPLTLILGPINKLLNSHLPSADINALKMVNRNANRLLTMIEQILQLAKVSNNDAITYYRIKIAVHIQAIVASFQPLATDKRIDLQLLDNEDAAINTSQDALEIILGNLLSNAIKYTQSGGKIRVSSTITDNKVLIQVTDTGCGLDEQQQKDIFNRFKRLDSHHNIDGIGIGLNVVEDIVNINNAELNIKSKPGEGSTFSVSFASIDLDFTELEQQHESLLIKQLANENTDLNTTPDMQQTANNQHKESILIIDDNHDMRVHIAETIKDYYYCYLAAGGKAGIALAIKHVPDIIICDVMMPEMDGFHVARVLRSDSRTSHIPLMLLTALDDRESRIRGWREHVDVYLTKPFDAQELLLQLENILVIRNILKKQAGQKIKAGQSANNIDLPKRDQQFINKLNALIAKKYQDPNYLRPQMASDMAVSQRQLQRKLKALIDKNPMDLLREYRLSQAAIMLKDGYQVSITSDACGFNSLSHFSKCFKSQFGLPPKVYQTTCNQ